MVAIEIFSVRGRAQRWSLSNKLKKQSQQENHTLVIDIRLVEQHTTQFRLTQAAHTRAADRARRQTALVVVLCQHCFVELRIVQCDTHGGAGGDDAVAVCWRDWCVGELG